MTATMPDVAMPVRRIRMAMLSRMREYLIASCIFLALTVAFFNPVFRGFSFSYVGAEQNITFPWRGHPTPYVGTYPQTDEGDAFYPYLVNVVRSLQGHSLPLWNPYSFGGHPFFANGNTGVLYPPRFALAVFLSADWVHDLSIMLHVFLSGLAMFAVMKGYRVGFAGALLAGIAWMLNTFTFAWIQLEHIIVITLFLPVAIGFIHRAAIQHSAWLAVGAGVALGLLALGGNVEFVLMTYIVCLLYAGLLAVRLSLPFLGKRVWKKGFLTLLQPGLIVMVALGIAVVQLLPTYALVADNARVPYSYSEYVKNWVVSSSAYLNTFFHPALPLTAAEMNFKMTFVGLPTALFAIIGFFQRRPGATFARVLAIGLFLISIGTPATWLIYHLIPNFGSIRPLGRALWLWDFAIAILGGIGLDACLRWARAPHVAYLRRLPGQSLVRRLSMGIRRNDRFIFGAVSATAVYAILFTAIQLGAYDRAINPPFEIRQSQYLYPKTPLLNALDKDQRTYGSGEMQRVFPVRRSFIGVPWTAPMLYAADALASGYDSAEGYDSLVPERTADLWRVVQGEKPDAVLTNKLQSAYIPSYYPQTTRFDLLPRLGVTTILTTPDIDGDPTWIPARYAPLQLRRVYSGADGRVFDIVNPAQRAYVVYNAESVATPAEALQRFTDPAFDYQHRVIFESTEHVDIPTTPSAVPANVPEARTIITKHGMNDLALEVTSDQPGWLVIADMWAPGWQGWVNGQATDVHRADFGLRAVAIPAGVSHVELSYRSKEFVAGLAITTGTVGIILIAAVLTLVLRIRRRHAFRREHEQRLRGSSPLV